MSESLLLQEKSGAWVFGELSGKALAYDEWALDWISPYPEFAEKEGGEVYFKFFL
jgi:hypothetical protein